MQTLHVCHGMAHLQLESECGLLSFLDMSSLFIELGREKPAGGGE